MTKSIVVLLLALLPIAAEAATCTIIIYYSDASLNRPVGSWSNCPGQKGLQGKRTVHKETMTEQIGGPTPTATPGKLPCEFLAKGCQPLPRARP